LDVRVGSSHTLRLPDLSAQGRASSALRIFIGQEPALRENWLVAFGELAHPLSGTRDCVVGEGLADLGEIIGFGHCPKRVFCPVFEGLLWPRIVEANPPDMIWDPAFEPWPLACCANIGGFGGGGGGCGGGGDGVEIKRGRSYQLLFHL